MKFKLSLLFVLNFLLLNSSVAVDNPWENNTNFDQLNSKLREALPLEGKKLRFHVDLTSHQGWRGNIATLELVGNDFFCDFQLKEQHHGKVIVKKGRTFKVIHQEAYFASDIEISRVGIVLNLSENDENGDKNPLDFLICLRHQQRDQILDGWTLEKEAYFDFGELKGLINGRIEIQ